MTDHPAEPTTEELTKIRQWSPKLARSIENMAHYIASLTAAKDAAEKQCEELRDRVDGLEADLDSAIEVMCRRISGDGTINGMRGWLEINYNNHPHVRALASSPKEGT